MSTAVRLLLYSHDSWGLGHLRRNLAIAHALVKSLPDASVLILSGSPCATQFRLPPRTDVVKLPCVGKNEIGAYQSRHLGGDLGVVLELRKALLLRAYESFCPHLVLVDHAAIGLGGELLPVLRAAHGSGVPCIYGMRDVLDSPARTEEGWASEEVQWAFTQCYAQVVVYGERKLFDTIACYPSLSAIADKVRYVGLLANTSGVDSLEPLDSRHVVVTAGGGEDGLALLRSYLAGLPEESDGVPCFSTVVAGPLLAPEYYDELKALAERKGHVRLLRFHKRLPALIASADLVVSMAGYNSCAEILASGRPSILVPRTYPRQEQLLRARYLQLAGLAEMLLEPTPQRLWLSVERALTAAINPPVTPMNGAANLQQLIGDTLRRDVGMVTRKVAGEVADA